MDLLFKAAPHALVKVPGTRAIPGQPARYIGRELKGGQYVEGEPSKIDWDALELEHQNRLRRSIADGDLIPGDETTAGFFGLKFAKSAKKDA